MDTYIYIDWMPPSRFEGACRRAADLAVVVVPDIRMGCIDPVQGVLGPGGWEVASRLGRNQALVVCEEVVQQELGPAACFEAGLHSPPASLRPCLWNQVNRYGDTRTSCIPCNRAAQQSSNPEMMMPYAMRGHAMAEMRRVPQPCDPKRML